MTRTVWQGSTRRSSNATWRPLGGGFVARDITYQAARWCAASVDVLLSTSLALRYALARGRRRVRSAASPLPRREAEERTTAQKWSGGRRIAACYSPGACERGRRMRRRHCCRKEEGQDSEVQICHSARHVSGACGRRVPAGWRFQRLRWRHLRAHTSWSTVARRALHIASRAP